jgi:pimeloyl-ACP methyl ester carboxylesterase
MSCTTSLLLLAVVTGAAPSAETFDMTVADAPYGTEEFVRTEGPEGTVLTGKVSLKVPGMADAVLSQEVKLARDGHPVSYALDIDAPGQQFVLRALPTATGYTVSITPKGTEEPFKTSEVAGKTPVFLLDNNFASHIDAFTRSLVGLGAGEERALTALVPQVLQAIPASVKRGDDGKSSLGGNPVATRSYRLVVANVATDLIVRSADGALLQAEVPVQRATLKRRGFAPAAAGPVANHDAPTMDARERAIDIKGPAAALPALLLMPKSETPVPAVVFLSGSGPNDKDETIGPNKPFADIAKGLGDRGIASLRFDKRTLVIKDRSQFADVSLKDEYYDDAAVALAIVGATSGIDPERIFVVGHSEGAMVAAKVAAAFPGTRGVVMMAPGVRPIDVMLIEQMEFGARLTGRSADEIAAQTKDLTETFAAIRDPKKKDTPPFMGAPASYWREVIALDVPEMVRNSKLPILVLQGDQDIQVKKGADFELLRTRAGTSDGRVTYRSFAGLNHLFMKVERESTGAEYGIPGHVDPAVISAIADWILLR